MATANHREFKPTFPMSVPMTIMIPTEERIQGVPTKTLQAGDLFFGSYRQFNSTNRNSNGVETPERVVVVDTWYRPDIKSHHKIRMEETGDIFDILGDPEDIGMRHQFLEMRLRRSGGKA